MIQTQSPLLFCSLAVLLITAAVQPCASQTRDATEDCRMKDDYFRTYDTDISQGFKGLDALISLREFIDASDVSYSSQSLNGINFYDNVVVALFLN